MTGFDLFGKILIVLIFPVNFIQKNYFVGKWQHCFLIFICFLNFCREFCWCGSTKIEITSLIDKI